MRRLVYMTVGILCACFALETWFWDAPMFLIGLAAAGAGFIALLFRSRVAHIAAVSALGFAVGAFMLCGFKTHFYAPLIPFDGCETDLQITVTDYPLPSRYGSTVNGRVSMDGANYSVKVFLNDYRDLEPGDILEGTFLLRLTTPGGTFESEYYQGKGQFLIASVRGEWDVHIAENVHFRFLPVRFAHKAKTILDYCFSGQTAAFAKALFLGETRDLSYEFDTALKVSGIRHIVAVSGLHIGILFSVVYHLTGLRRPFFYPVSLAFLFFFSAAAGFTPSVSRACLSMAVMATCLEFRMAYDSLSAMALACLIMTIVNPMVVQSVSFQLSLGSVSGILLFGRRVQSGIREVLEEAIPKCTSIKPIRWAIGTAAISIASMVFVVPINMYYFGTVSILGIITNIASLWAVGIIFCGIAVVVLLGFFSLSLSSMFAWLLSYMIRYVLWVAQMVSRIPFAALYTNSFFTVGWVILCYCLLLLYVISGCRAKRLCCSAALAGLLMCILLSCLLPRLDALRITVMDVGEGQCVLLQQGSNAFLVDCGGDDDDKTADIAAQTLLSQGILRLDGIALTHYDRDHTGALHNLLTRVDTDRLYIPQWTDKSKMQQVIEGTDIPVTVVSQDWLLPLGNARIMLFRPDDSKTDNENGMCILFADPNYAILITGDRGKSGEKRLMQHVGLPDVDVLIAGHHGSKNSTSMELLEAVRPETVLISCGAKNNYGHPAPELLGRLAEMGCTVLRTDLDGTIVIRR